MIPIDVDALLAKIRGKYSSAGVTEVTRVTAPVTPSNHAVQEPLTAVTHADPWQGNKGNTPGTSATDSGAVTPVTLLPPALGNSRRVSQDIDTAKVSTAVTLVTQEKERAALALLQQLHDLGIVLTPYPNGTLRYKAPTGTMTSALLDALRQHKSELHALGEVFEEHTSIMQYDGGLPREEAECLAWGGIFGKE